MTDTYTSDDGNAFKVRKGTGRRMKKHRVKIRGERDKKTKEDLSSPNVVDNPEQPDEQVEVKVQERKREIVIHYVKETAIDDHAQAKEVVDSSEQDKSSTFEVQEKCEDAKVVEQSNFQLKESQNGHAKSELECPSECEGNHEIERPSESIGNHDLTETESSSPAENRVLCDVHIQNVAVEVAIDADKKSDNESDIIESTDL